MEEGIEKWSSSSISPERFLGPQLSGESGAETDASGLTYETNQCQRETGALDFSRGSKTEHDQYAYTLQTPEKEAPCK